MSKDLNLQYNPELRLTNVTRSLLQRRLASSTVLTNSNYSKNQSIDVLQNKSESGSSKSQLSLGGRIKNFLVEKFSPPQQPVVNPTVQPEKRLVTVSNTPKPENTSVRDSYLAHLDASTFLYQNESTLASREKGRRTVDDSDSDTDSITLYSKPISSHFVNNAYVPAQSINEARSHYDVHDDVQVEELSGAAAEATSAKYPLEPAVFIQNETAVQHLNINWAVQDEERLLHTAVVDRPTETETVVKEFFVEYDETDDSFVESSILEASFFRNL